MPALCLLVSRKCFTSGFRAVSCRPIRVKSRLFSGSIKTETSLQTEAKRLKSPPEKLLVHWRGEDTVGYSLTFRHPEFRGALSAVTNQSFENSKSPIHFQNALEYDGEAFMDETKLIAFNQAMQWITLNDDASDSFDRNDFSLEKFIATVSRCSLIHTLYEVVAEGDTYEELNDKALKNGRFQDVMRGGENENDSWAVRVRHFGDEAGTKKERRHGGRTRSVNMEQEALLALKPMLLKFGGRVDLRNPDCKIYVFDGMMGKKVLARKIASGPKVRFHNQSFLFECLSEKKP